MSCYIIYKGKNYTQEDFLDFLKTQIPSSSTLNNPSEFTNHSGGAYGGDTMWDQIGREFGVTEHKHYRDAGNTSLSRKLRNNKVEATVLTSEQMEEARAQVEKLLGKKFPNTTQGNLQVRNYYQVANADAVYAIATLNDSKTGVSGGTNTAVQLGIKLNKPTYVWDINTEQWYKFEGVNNSFSVAIIPQNLTSGETAFGTTQVANEEAKELLGPKPTSIDMVEAGIRTRTTRSVGEMEKYNIKVGDIVTQRGKSADGSIKEIKTRITAIHPKGTPEFLGNWDKEGWTQEGIDAIKRYKDGAAAIEFEVITNNLDNNSGFIPTETPTLTKNFAGVGTRDIENYNTLDKTTNKWTPRKEYVGDKKALAAQQAIRDVYEKTFKNQENNTPYYIGDIVPEPNTSGQPINENNISKYELFPGVYANEGQRAAIDAIEELPRKKLVIFNPSVVESQQVSQPKVKVDIRAKVYELFNLQGYMDIKTSHKTDKNLITAISHYVLEDLGYKTDQEKLQAVREGFKLSEYITTEQISDVHTRVRLNMKNIIEDEVDDGPVSLGGIKFTSSGYESNAKNAFTCK